VKPFAPLTLALALLAASATAARAHVDSLGQPDPYWQQVAAAAAAADAARGGTAPFQDLVSSGGLSLLLLVLGAALALDVATAPARRKRTADPSAGTMGEAAVRTVAGLPPSANGETRHVLRAAAAIAVVALVVSGLHASERGGDRAPQARDLAPFQMPFRDATPTVQRLFREIEAGLPAAENLRVATTRWPTVETLAAQGIPPFPSADSPYRWRLIQEGASTAYVGAPAPGSDAPALLALIQEPAPGSADAALPAPLPGEFQQRLSDGTPLRVSIWFCPDGSAADDQATGAMLARPFAAGWKQVLGENQGS
jgi:hypothetical protein